MSSTHGDETTPLLSEVLTRLFVSIVGPDDAPITYGVSIFKVAENWMAIGMARPEEGEEIDESTGIVKSSQLSAADAVSQVLTELLTVRDIESRLRPIDVPRRRESTETDK